MFVTFAKRNGLTEKSVERRNCVRNGNQTLKEARLKTSNDSGKRNDGQAGVESSLRENTKSNTSDISRPRPRRKRRRRRRRVRKSQEEIQSPAHELKFQVRRKRGRRKRKRKRKVHIKENVMFLESSGSASTQPLLSNSSPQSFSQSSNDLSHVSSMECENLPWANLEVPMDLSLVNLEVNGHGVDFEMQAQENHLRWLANLEKVREKAICLDDTSQ